MLGKAALGAVFLLSAQPALACHFYKYWAYPTAQPCGRDGRYHGGAMTTVKVVPPPAVKPVPAAVKPAPPPLPLPDLTAIVWGDSGDPETRGRLLLRAKLSQPGAFSDDNRR